MTELVELIKRTPAELIEGRHPFRLSVSGWRLSTLEGLEENLPESAMLKVLVIDPEKKTILVIFGVHNNCRKDIISKFKQWGIHEQPLFWEVAIRRDLCTKDNGKPYEVCRS